jgi:UPF0755 protein
MDKHQKRGGKGWIVLLVIVLLLGGGGFFAWNTYNTSTQPMDGADKKPIAITIPDGASTQSIAGILKKAKLIRDVTLFKFHSKLKKNDGKYKSGAYEMSRAMSTDEIMASLMSGGKSDSGNTKRFTIPEGYNTLQTMNRLVKEGFVTEEDFMEEVKNGAFDYPFLEGTPNDESRLEGFLYPETYDVYDDATAHDIIDKMLSQFNKLFKEEYYAKAEKMGYSVREIVTMGSVIERESKAADERPVMAGVFYNRLKENMKLQSCATIQYILGEPKEFLTNADTQIESPYNTYLHEGLPPGPICSPRMASVEAALYPDDNDYIYFVVSPELNGTHNFSADYNKFLRDKDAYYEAVENRE